MNTYTPPLSLAVTSIYLTTSKEAKGCEQWDSQTSRMEDTTSRLPKRGACLMATRASSDLQVSASSAQSSNDLIPPSLKLPSTSHPWTFSPSTLLSWGPFPPETFLSQQMPPQSPCPAHSLIPKHPCSSHPSALSCPLFSSCTWLNPSFCLGSLWREKACVLKDVLKILPDTYSTYSEGGKKNPKQQVYLRYRQEALPMPPWLSADGGIWCTLHLHTPPKKLKTMSPKYMV